MKKPVRQIMPIVTGLGDVVHAVANPIARVIDKAAGTNLQNCGGCQSRREKLNQKFPMKQIIPILLLLVAFNASALDFTYSTNLYAGSNNIVLTYMGTSSGDTNSKATFIEMVNALNHNAQWLAAQNQSRMDYAKTNGAFTNLLSTPAITLDATTISHSTNPTTLPLGTMLANDSYLYRVVGHSTNAVGTNFYRIPWDTNSW